MTKTTYIGDLHGKIAEAQRVLRRTTYPTFCVGDVGIGFTKDGARVSTEEMPDNFRWCHGNHDDPQACIQAKGYLGRYGFAPNGQFFVSGAFSVDSFYRTAGVDWFWNEQLNLEEQHDCYRLYQENTSGVEVVVTHDCPRSLYPYMLERIGKPRGPLFENATSHFLQALLEIHRPKIWIYGHWHRSVDETFDGTRFICLSELETITLPNA